MSETVAAAPSPLRAPHTAPPPPATPPPTTFSAAALWHECILQLRLSLPISLSYMLGYVVLLTSQVLVGRISAASLAAASLGMVYGNTTGMAVIIGLTSACETLASQAFGAGNLPRVGAVAQRASAVLLAVCLPCGAAWLAAGPALRLLGQDEATVQLASTYIRLQLPGLPCAAVYEVLKRTLQSVGVAGPQVAIGVAAVVANAALGAVLVWGTPLGFLGAPLALSASQALQLALALLYIRRHREAHAAARALRAAWRRTVAGGAGWFGFGDERGTGGGAAEAERDAAGLAAAAAAEHRAIDLTPLDGSGGGSISSSANSGSGRQ